MLIRVGDIYKKVAEKKGLDPELVKSVGETVLQELRTKISKGDEIAYNLSKIGNFRLIQKDFMDYMTYLMKVVSEGLKDLSDPERYAEYERKKRILNKIYIYKANKKQKRKERYEQIEARKSSQD